MSRPARLNYFSFLDLMCCALGGALLILVLVNAEQPPAGERKTFTVEVETLFAAKFPAPRVAVTPLAHAEGDVFGNDLWHRHAPSVDGSKGLFFAAAPGTRDRSFRILVTVTELKELTGGDTTVPDEVVRAVEAARQLDRVERLLPPAEQVIAGAASADQYRRALGVEFPDGAIGPNVAKALYGQYAPKFGLDDDYRDVRILAYVAARISESPTPVVVTEALLPENWRQLDPTAVKRVKAYLALKAAAIGAGLRVEWAEPADPSVLPRSASDVVSAFEEARRGAGREGIPRRLCAKGLLWVAAAQMRLTPCHLRVEAAWDAVTPAAVVFAPGDRRVRAYRGEFEFRVALDESDNPGRVKFAEWSAAGRWVMPEGNR